MASDITDRPLLFLNRRPRDLDRPDNISALREEGYGVEEKGGSILPSGKRAQSTELNCVGAANDRSILGGLLLCCWLILSRIILSATASRGTLFLFLEASHSSKRTLDSFSSLSGSCLLSVFCRNSQRQRMGSFGCPDRFPKNNNIWSTKITSALWFESPFARDDDDDLSTIISESATIVYGSFRTPNTSTERHFSDRPSSKSRGCRVK